MITWPCGEPAAVEFATGTTLPDSAPGGIDHPESGVQSEADSSRTEVVGPWPV